MSKKLIISSITILVLIIIGLTTLAIIKNNENKSLKIPILLYHDVTTTIPATDLYNYEYITTIANLEENIKTLLDNDYQIITINDLYNLKKVPEKSVVITFDDGLISNYDLVFPLLKKYNIKVGMSITTDLMGTYNVEENRQYFSWAQAKEMAASGLVEFYSHGKRHIFYNELSLPDFESEIMQSISSIKENLNIDTNVFVYPYGSYNQCMVDTLKDNIKIQVYDLGINDYQKINYDFIKRINISYYMSGRDIINFINNN